MKYNAKRLAQGVKGEKNFESQLQAEMVNTLLSSKTQEAKTVLKNFMQAKRPPELKNLTQEIENYLLEKHESNAQAFQELRAEYKNSKHDYYDYCCCGKDYWIVKFSFKEKEVI